jgi:AbrB family looped-hinge helix DNA binding protein
MSHSTLTSKGQTTIPQEIREAVGLRTGAKLNWSVTPDGVLIARAKTQSLASLSGSVKIQAAQKVSIQDMNPWK